MQSMLILAHSWSKIWMTLWWIIFQKVIAVVLKHSVKKPLPSYRLKLSCYLEVVSWPSCMDMTWTGVQTGTETPGKKVTWIWHLLRYTNPRVGRVLSFFFSRPNWDSPNPSPAGECAPLPRFWGEGHTRWRERGWESPNSEERTYTVVLFIYTYFVLQTLATILNFRKNCYVENNRILQYTYCDFRKFLWPYEPLRTENILRDSIFCC